MTETEKQAIYTGLGLSEDEIAAMNSNPNWYNEISYNRKKQLYTQWKARYATSSSAVRDLLWPWNGSFQPGGGILRLINFRTDFQMKENLENGDVLDPFIFASLGKPNSY